MCDYILYPNLRTTIESQEVMDIIIKYLNQHITQALIDDYHDFLSNIDLDDCDYDTRELVNVGGLFKWEIVGDQIKIDLPRLSIIGWKPTHVDLYRYPEYINAILLKHGVPQHHFDVMVDQYGGNGSQESYFFDSYYCQKYYYIQNCIIEYNHQYITWFSYFANQLNPEIPWNHFKLKND